MENYTKSRHEFFWKHVNSESVEDNSNFSTLKRMSDSQLIFTILNKKNKKTKESIWEIAQTIDVCSDLSKPSVFLNIEGIDTENAMRLAAAFELARRKIHPLDRKIETAHEAFALLQNYAHLPQEHFITISLNGAGQTISTRVVTVGLVNQTQIHPREVFADVLTERASAVILAHNHPSGDLRPSAEDIRITERLTAAGALLGVQVLDHLIFCSRGFFSFRDEGIMPLL